MNTCLHSLEIHTLAAVRENVIGEDFTLFDRMAKRQDPLVELLRRVVLYDVAGVPFGSGTPSTSDQCIELSKTLSESAENRRVYAQNLGDRLKKIEGK